MMNMKATMLDDWLDCLVRFRIYNEDKEDNELTSEFGIFGNTSSKTVDTGIPMSVEILKNKYSIDDLEAYTLTRFMYSIGKPIISDPDYDVFENYVLNTYEMLISSYDDDEIPEDLLVKIYGREKATEYVGAAKPKKDEAFIDISNQVSKSMQSYRTLQECYPWINAHKSVELMVSPKIDGINTATSYVRDPNSMKFNYARTRGRSSRAFDISHNIIKKFPQEISLPNNIDNLVIAAEAILPRAYLETLNKAIYSVTGTNPEIHTPRGGGMSMLKRTDIPDEVYSNLRLFVFRCSYGRTFDESLAFAEANGFEVVPHEVYKFTYSNYSEYEKELSDLIYKYKGICDKMGITTDGIVLQVNDRKLAENEVSSKIADGDNLAVKALAWEADVYSSKVIDIVLEPSATHYNCKAIIEPVYNSSDKKLSIVNLYNIGMMIRNKVKIGSLIEFKYENETTISFLRNLSN